MNRLLACLLFLLIFPEFSSAQRRILERAERAIFQFNYQEAREELKLYLTKNNNAEDNAYKMMTARVYGDPESPWYNPDSAYKIMMSIFYYPTTYDEKIDAVVCKSFEACEDTIRSRKEQYAGAILQREIDRHSVTGIENFIKRFSEHDELVEKAQTQLHEMEFQKAKKADKLLLYDQFIEKYPDADQVGEAYRAMETLKYERAVRRNTVRDYEQFLEDYPKTEYRAAVMDHIRDVRWAYCVKGNDVERYREFKTHYPNSIYQQSADSAIRELQWKQVRQVHESAYYRWYLREYPKDDHTAEANRLMHDTRWSEVQTADQLTEYEAFVREFPDSPQVRSAQARIEELKHESLSETPEDH
ncbi:MAG: hypothetical protein H6608_03755 [Flavobacteriales bacterium]|nr:hypothetical protein [Flavobacteriales bacterium]